MKDFMKDYLCFTVVQNIVSFIQEKQTNCLKHKQLYNVLRIDFCKKHI